LGFICNLPARRSFGGVLGICDLIDLRRLEFGIYKNPGTVTFFNYYIERRTS